MRRTDLYAKLSGILPDTCLGGIFRLLYLFYVCVTVFMRSMQVFRLATLAVLSALFALAKRSQPSSLLVLSLVKEFNTFLC